MIDMSKTYRYRNGEPARILCVDAHDNFPVVSITKGGVPITHYRCGRCSLSWETDNDLIEVREPRVIWVNEYLKAFGSAWETEEAAKSEAGSWVIATRKFVEVIE